MIAVDREGAAMARTHKTRFLGLLCQARACTTLLGIAAIGAIIKLAREGAGSVKNTYCRWMQTGKALLLDAACREMPHAPSHQPDEPDFAWEASRVGNVKTRCQLVTICSPAIRASAQARIRWQGRMSGDQRAAKRLLNRAYAESCSRSPCLSSMAGEINRLAQKRGAAAVFQSPIRCGHLPNGPPVRSGSIMPKSAPCLSTGL